MATVTRTRRSGKYKTFDSLRDISLLPVSKRPELAIGRGGRKVKPRKYVLSPAEIEGLKAQHNAGVEVPNPFKRNFSYLYIETLRSLGANRNHSEERVLAKFKELASDPSTKNDSGKTFYQRYKNKPMRNKDTGREFEGRFAQAVEVLQRVVRPGREDNKNPYGEKLKEVGTKVLGTKGVVIDIVIGSTGAVMHRLNTNSAYPVNETKRRSKAVAAESVAAPAVEVATAPETVATPEAVVDVPVVTAEATVEAPATPVEVTGTVESQPEVAPAPEIAEATQETTEAPATEVAAESVAS